jgi:hypothetical protein
MLFDGASLCYFQGKPTDTLEYLTPHNIDFQVADINLSELNPRDPSAQKPAIVFDKEQLDISLTCKKHKLPSKFVDVLEVSQIVRQFVCNFLSYLPQKIQVNNKIVVKHVKDVRILARPSMYSPQKMFEINEHLNVFKAVGLYCLEYLFKTRAGGYFIALSGGSDSTLNALFIRFACQSLNFFMYQKANHEIIDKLSYIIDQPVSFVKVKLTEKEKRSQFYLSGTELKQHPEWYELSSVQKDFLPEDCFQYMMNEDQLVTADTISKRILNVAYLPMNFSGITKPFVDKLVTHLNCNFLNFNINSSFDAMKTQVEEMLVR